MDICRRQFGACVLGAMARPIFGSPIPRTRLIVLVLAEELRADAIDAAWPQMGTGGLKKIFEKGSWFPDCRHTSSTFSACGIANLATGAWPSQHGIVAEQWYDRAAKRTVSASDEELLATTLAAQVAADSNSRVTVVSGSRKQGALFAGTPKARLYFMDERGRFAGSGDNPDWLTAYNDARSPDNSHDAKWMAVNAAPDAPPLRTLTFDRARPAEFVTLYKASPFGQTAQYDFAAELVSRNRLGQGKGSDLLCILDSASCLLGYEVGGRSPLLRQMTLQLDRRIETLLAALTREVGENGFSLVLCAAHGAAPEPPAEARGRMAVSGESIAQSVAKALKDSGRKVEKYVYPFLYLDAARDSGPARVAAAQAALDHPAVAGYYTADGICSVRDEWEQRFRRSFHPKRSGDVMLSYWPEYVEDYGAGRGISYGSLYDYDTRVPLCFYGPTFQAGTFEGPVEAVDVAPTVARAMGVAAPSSSVGRVLGEAFAV